MKIKQIEFKNNLKHTLRGYIHEPKIYKTALIFLHGFPGSMNGTAKRFSNSMSKKGYLCMRFDFSGTNTSDGKFENKIMSQEVKDIKYGIDFLIKNYEFKKLILLGHSTGAIDAALYCSKDKRINKTVLSGAISKLDESASIDFSDRQVRDFWKKGYIIYKNLGKWYNNKKLKKPFYDEFFTLNIEKSIKKYRRPLLIIHGSEDEAIPVSCPKELYKIANKPKKIVIIK